MIFLFLNPRGIHEGGLSPAGLKNPLGLIQMIDTRKGRHVMFMDKAAIDKAFSRIKLKTATEMQQVTKNSLFKRFKALDLWGQKAVIETLLINEERVLAERKQGFSIVQGGKE